MAFWATVVLVVLGHYFTYFGGPGLWYIVYGMWFVFFGSPG